MAMFGTYPWLLEQQEKSRKILDQRFAEAEEAVRRDFDRRLKESRQALFDSASSLASRAHPGRYEVADLREQVARLRERVAVLEAALATKATP